MQDTVMYPLTLIMTGNRNFQTGTAILSHFFFQEHLVILNNNKRYYRQNILPVAA